MTAPGSRPLAYLGVLLLGGGVAALTATLARVLTVAMGHHLAYLVVGTALLGFAAGGSFVTLGALRRPRRERPDAVIATHALAAAIAAPLAHLMLTRVMFEPVRVIDEPINLVGLLLIEAITATPFVFAGAATCGAIAFYRARVGAAYGVTLVGAGLGALAVPFALEPLTGPGLLVAAACTLAIASACFGFSDCRARGSIAAALRATVVLALACVVGWKLLPAARAGRLDLRPVPGKDISAAILADAVEFTRWSPFARIDVSKERPSMPMPGVAFGGKALAPPWRAVFRDGAAATLLLAAPVPNELDFLRHSTTGAAYGVLEARGCREFETLALDVGGGIDLQVALAHGATRVTGIESDPVLLDLLRTRYADDTGRLAERPDVQLLGADGRRFVRMSTRRFDLIQLNGTDPPTALDAGAPTAGSRYTVEAFGELFDKLRDERSSQGLVCASRYLRPDQPQQALRLAATAVEALEARGVRDAHRNVFALHGGSTPTPWASFLFGPQPFAADELRGLRAFCAANGFTIVFDPERTGSSPFDACLRSGATARARFFAEYPSDVTPRRDDRPFFHDLLRWSTLLRSGPAGAQTLLSRVPVDCLVLLLAMLQAVMLGAAFLTRPLRDLDRGASDGTTLGTLLCFGALGVTLAALELALGQHVSRLLEPPTVGALAMPVMLASAGLGALTVTPRTRPRRRLSLVALAAPLLIITAWWGVTHELDAWLERSLAFRIGVAAALLTPGPFLLGMAFAAAVHLLDVRRPELVPWAFAVHAFALVSGAAAALLLAMHAGYAVLLFTIAGVCALGLGAILWTLRFRGDAARRDVVSLEPTGHEGDPE